MAGGRDVPVVVEWKSLNSEFLPPFSSGEMSSLSHVLAFGVGGVGGVSGQRGLWDGAVLCDKLSSAVPRQSSWRAQVQGVGSKGKGGC